MSKMKANQNDGDDNSNQMQTKIGFQPLEVENVPTGQTSRQAG